MIKNYSIKQNDDTSLVIHIKSYKDSYSIFELIFSCLVITGILIFINVKIPNDENFLLKGMAELYLLFWLFRMIRTILWFTSGYEMLQIDHSTQKIHFHRKGFGKFHRNQFDLNSTKFIHVKKHQVEHFYTVENRTSNGLKNGQLVFERLSKKWHQSIYFHFGHSLTDIELQDVYNIIQLEIPKK